MDEKNMVPYEDLKSFIIKIFSNFQWEIEMEYTEMKNIIDE